MGEEVLECEVCVDRTRLEHVSEFKYLRCVQDESGTDQAVCRRKVASEGVSQVLLGLWLMLEFCSLSDLGSCMSHCSCLFSYMIV